MNRGEASPTIVGSPARFLYHPLARRAGVSITPHSGSPRTRTLPTVSESPEQIRKHIAVLEDFEQKYGEFIVAEHDRRVESRSDWSSRQWAERLREIRSLAPRADAAIDASGVGGLAVHWPPALGGGLKADDLASMIFEVRPSAFGDEQPDHELRQAIMDRLPTQIEGLKMRLEEIEAQPDRSISFPGWPKLRWGWINHPWTITVVGGIVAAVIAGLIVALIVNG